MRRIYIAGALTPTGVSGHNLAIEYLMNVRRMLIVALKLIKHGYVPYVPALDLLLFIAQDEQEVQLDEAKVKDNSLVWLKVCDALVLTAGWETSSGCKREMKVAQELGIPIFETVEDLLANKTLNLGGNYG